QASVEVFLRFGLPAFHDQNQASVHTSRWKIRVKLKCMIKVSKGLIKLAFAHPGNPSALVNAANFWIQLDCAVKICNRSIIISLLDVNVAAVIERFSVFRVQLNR